MPAPVAALIVEIVLLASTLIKGIVRKKGDRVRVRNRVARDLLNRKRARVATPDDPPCAEDSSPSADFATMTKSELLRECNAAGIKPPPGANKDALVALLTQAAAAASEAAATDAE